MRGPGFSRGGERAASHRISCARSQHVQRASQRAQHASQRAQRAQLLEDAGGGGQQLLVPAQRVVQAHVHLGGKTVAVEQIGRAGQAKGGFGELCARPRRSESGAGVCTCGVGAGKRGAHLQREAAMSSHPPSHPASHPPAPLRRPSSAAAARARLHGGLAAGRVAFLDAHDLGAQDQGLVGRRGLLERRLHRRRRTQRAGSWGGGDTSRGTAGGAAAAHREARQLGQRQRLLRKLSMRRDAAAAPPAVPIANRSLYTQRACLRRCIQRNDRK